MQDPFEKAWDSAIKSLQEALEQQVKDASKVLPDTLPTELNWKRPDFEDLVVDADEL